MRKAKQTEQKEIGRVKLSDTQELVASIVDNEKLQCFTVLATQRFDVIVLKCQDKGGPEGVSKK